MSDSTVERFPTSGCPRNLEWYKCYDDPNRTVWIDGREIEANRDSWDEKQCAKWDFFYRPIRAMIGRPQKKLIRKCEQELFHLEATLKRVRTILIRDLILCGLGLIPAGWLWEYLLLVPLAIAAGRGIWFAWQRRKIQRHIEEVTMRHDRLGNEIQELQDQVPQAPSARQAEEWLKEELQALEHKCLAEIVNKDTDDPTLFKDINHDPIEAENNPFGLRGLLIHGWGPLQPPTIRGPFGSERTGLLRVVKDLGASIATWRRGTTGQPIYRVMYLQFVFLLERNINVYGFFYDFVTRKQYGKRTETLLYNHVTSYSIREVEIDEDEWIRGIDLPATFREDLMKKEINAFSLVVSSGTYFRCVLSDNTVVDAINHWLEADERTRKQQEELEQASRSAERKADGDTNPELRERWQREDQQVQQELLLQVAEQRKKLEDQDIHLARRSLQQIREAVDSFVHWVQPASQKEAAPESRTAP